MGLCLIGVDEVLCRVTDDPCEVAFVPAFMRSTKRLYIFEKPSVIFSFRNECAPGRARLGPLLAARNRNGGLGGSTSDDLQSAGSVDVECTDDGLGIKQVPKPFRHVLILFAVIPLGILPRFPKTEGEHPIRLPIRHEQDLVDEAVLRLQEGTAFSLIALESSLALLGLLVSSTTRVNIYGSFRRLKVERKASPDAAVGHFSCVCN